MPNGHPGSASLRGVGRATRAGAALGAAAGLLWAWAYALAAGAALAWTAGHALAGALLAAGAARLTGARGLAPAAVVVLLALVALPAVLGGGPDAPGVLPPRPLVEAEVRDPVARRVAVIGLDGADWRVIDPLFAEGQLPELRRLLERGRGWVLRSIEPSSSPVVWSSIFSGRRPEAHGLVDWDASRADNRRAGMLWELVGAAGLPSVVVNVPGSWPPTAVRGALVSGFPMPSPLRPAGDATGFQNLGTLLDPEGRPAALPVVTGADPAEPTGARVVVGRAAARSGVGLRHPAVEAAVARRWLATRSVGVRLRAPGLAAGAWSAWQRADGEGPPLVVRMRRLADGRTWVTPAFQDPRAPSHAFTSDAGVTGALGGEGEPYVVEGAGWRLAEEPALRPVLIEHLEEVERRHLDAARGLLEAVPDWRLLAHVITLPDRVSHAFWRFHAPADYPPAPEAEQAAHRERVRDAYRRADALLGELLEAVDDGTTLILVASDHGFASSPPTWGNHRDAGVLVAAGPGVEPSGERGERSIFDVTPLALAALGLPVADDMDGAVPAELGLRVRAIASWERGGAPAPAGERIDETTTEQLRSLGYVE